MTTKITATELARNLSDVLNRARYRGESFAIERNGEAVARLEPAGAPIGTPFSELVKRLRGLPRPDEAFADDLEEIHAAQGETGPPPTWPD